MMPFGSLDSAPFLGTCTDRFLVLPGIPEPEYVKLLGLCVCLSGCSAETPNSCVLDPRPWWHGLMKGSDTWVAKIHGRSMVSQAGSHTHSWLPLAGGVGSFGSMLFPGGALPSTSGLLCSLWVVLSA